MTTKTKERRPRNTHEMVDYATLEELQEIHKVDPGIPLHDIPRPDFIWGKQSLQDSDLLQCRTKQSGPGPGPEAYLCVETFN